ncbi:MAG: RnfABCDGE type electron transport complex subunit D [Lentisphaerae bacterium]|nr:RnfABCDGE type electron transport complex subunit D [Lentisphaerota bacterium]
MLPKGEELVLSSSPHIHVTENIQSIMLKVVLAMLPALAAAIWFFGIPALLVIFWCVLFCLVLEIIWCRIAGKPASVVKDGSALVTGLLLAMNLPPVTAWWVCLLGALLAIWLGKQVFGGLGQNPFNPAAVARVGLLIALPRQLTYWIPSSGMTADAANYSEVFYAAADFTKIEQAGQVIDGITCATPLSIAQNTPKILDSGVAAADNFAAIANPESYWQYFIGNMGGSLGETSTLAILIGGIILLSFKLIRWQIPLFYLGTVAVFTGLIHLIWPGVTPPPLFHLLTGGLMLAAFFMATDMVTSPITGRGAAIFGIGLGVMTCVIRIWGGFPEGVSFSILLMNALVPLIERMAKLKPFGFRKPTPAKGA